MTRVQTEETGPASGHLPSLPSLFVVSFMAHIHLVLQGGRPASSLLSSDIAR